MGLNVSQSCHWSGGWGWGPGIDACTLVGGAVSRANARLLVCGTRSWALWWTRLSPRVAVGSESHKAVSLLMSGPVSLPGLLLGPEASKDGGYRQVGRASAKTNKLERGFQHGARQHQCPHERISSPKWLLLVSVPPGSAPFASCLSRNCSKISR